MNVTWSFNFWWILINLLPWYGFNSNWILVVCHCTLGIYTRQTNFNQVNIFPVQIITLPFLAFHLIFSRCCIIHFHQHKWLKESDLFSSSICHLPLCLHRCGNVRSHGVISFVQHYIFLTSWHRWPCPFPVLLLLPHLPWVSLFYSPAALPLLHVVLFIPVQMCWPLLHLQHILFASAPPSITSLSLISPNLLACHLQHSFILTSPLNSTVLRAPTPVRGCLQKLQLFFSLGLGLLATFFFVVFLWSCLSVVDVLFQSDGVCSNCLCSIGH